MCFRNVPLILFYCLFIVLLFYRILIKRFNQRFYVSVIDQCYFQVIWFQFVLESVRSIVEFVSLVARVCSFFLVETFRSTSSSTDKIYVLLFFGRFMSRVKMPQRILFIEDVLLTLNIWSINSSFNLEYSKRRHLRSCYQQRWNLDFHTDTHER